MLLILEEVIMLKETGGEAKQGKVPIPLQKQSLLCSLGGKDWIKTGYSFEMAF